MVFAPGVPGLPNSDVYGDMQAAAEKGNKTLGPEAYTVKPVADNSWFGLLLTGLLPLLDHRRLHLLHDAAGAGHE